MELRLLRYFLTAAQEKNITRAAEYLYITQPTLSRQLTQLEDEMGVTLFDKSSRRLELTEAGRLLQRRAVEILELVDKTEKELSSEGGEEGTVSLCCGEISSVQVVADLFRAFRDKYPRVHLELYAANAELASERLEQGLADMAVFLEPADLSHYEYIRLPVKERWAVLLPAGDPLCRKSCIEPADLDGKNLIFPWRSIVKKEIRNWFGPYFSRIGQTIDCNMSTNASIFVYKGLGYSLCIEGARPFLDESRVCRRPLSPPIETGTVLVWRKYTPFSRAVENFASFTREYLKDGYAARKL